MRCLFTLVLLSLLSLDLAAAPAPLPRKKQPRPEIPIHCVMHWNGMQYDTTFYRGGRYEAAWRADDGATRYVGSWRLDEGTRLTISESREGSDFAPHKYEIALEPCLTRGRFAWSDSGSIKIEKK